MTAFDEVDQYVIVMMENRSFDHMLGYLALDPWRQQRADPVRGFDPTRRYPTRTPGDTRGIHRITTEDLTAAPPHERRPVWDQLNRNAQGDYQMDGFVRASYPAGMTVPQEPYCLGYLTPDCIPITNYFAQQFRVCDAWHCAIPSSTHPNRMMAICGFTPYDVTDTQSTSIDTDLFRFLDRNHVAWGVYARRMSMFALITHWSIDALAHRNNFHKWGDFEAHWRSPDIVPRVWYLEPGYNDAPIGDGPKEDDHPPLSCNHGQAFLHEVYRIIRANDARWKRTLMVLVYDEHGGFFDHVPPLRIVTHGPPVPHGQGVIWPDFPCTGPRVPAILISPWVEPGSTATANFDHCSIIKSIVEKFAPNDTEYFVDLAGRECVFSRGVSSIGAELSLDAARDVDAPCPPFPEPPTGNQVVAPSAISKLLSAANAKVKQ